MDAKEMKTSNLIIGLMGAHSWEGLYQSDFAAEIDRRFPVPVEREQEAKLPRVRASDQCCARKQSGNHADAVRYCCLAAGHTGRHETVYRESFDGDYLPPLEARRAHCDEDDCTCNYCRPSRDAFVSDDKARAESTGKDVVPGEEWPPCVHGVSPARCTQCAQPAPRYDEVFAQGTAILDADARGEPAPAAPTDAWISVRDDEATVDVIARAFGANWSPVESKTDTARRILAALKALRDGERK